MKSKLYWGCATVLFVVAFVGLVQEITDPEAAYKRTVDQYTHLYTYGVKGGETPRETLDLFITALDEGDIDEALLYVDPEQRDRYEADMREGLENGNLELVLEDYRNIDHENKVGDSRYEFYSTDLKTGTRLTYGLFYNDLANIWMFESI
ncbi:MAG: hypothetical protein Q8P93_02525 [bacterium]|nr:hypothetical protein [bacterium]